MKVEDAGATLSVARSTTASPCSASSRRLRARADRLVDRRQLSRSRSNAPPLRGVVRAYLDKEMWDGTPAAGKFDLFAVEGGTAAMCYVFKSLVENRIFHRGDTIALGTPIFTPYLEMPHLEDFELQDRHVDQAQMAGRFPRLAVHRRGAGEARRPRRQGVLHRQPVEPCVVRDGARGARPDRRAWSATKRKDLIILTDDVYGTFMPGFRSLRVRPARGTLFSSIRTPSTSVYRLAARRRSPLHEDNVVDDDARQALPDEASASSTERYGSLTPDASRLKFIDRMVADSRDVAPTEQPRAAGANGRARRVFLLPLQAAREQQAADVGAGDEEQQADRAEQRHAAAARLHGSGRATGLAVAVRPASRDRPWRYRPTCRDLALRLRRRRTRLQPRDGVAGATLDGGLVGGHARTRSPPWR